MRWLRDRRGYGQLRLPYPRYRRRRASWLEQDLRARRRHLLRANWRDLTKLLAAFALAAVSFSYGAREHPQLQAGILGVFLGAAAVGWAGFLALADGSLLARLGRGVEGDVGDELRTTDGVYGVISAIPFEHFDVDHVVLAPKGCFALEVKALFSRQQSLEDTYGLESKLRQARQGATKTAALLRSHGIHTPVRPVLVLAGPGAPNLHSQVVDRDGVLIVAFRDSDTWRPVMAGPTSPDQALPLDTAAKAAEHLATFCERREQHQRLKIQQRRGQQDGLRRGAPETQHKLSRGRR
ncbi:nuclease-related domain-containing protein [Kineococcus radiotolerans]|uniref:nuclease-related domain-containing protein n=1 Tax=Kineococcus radiotolerans TaxID=131568 RepID=UPI00003A3C3E|nr:nuclease-related domain-containing protein [Kineococcus radiotolerans]